MAISDDKVTLTNAERQALALLEERAVHDYPQLESSLRAGLERWRRSRARDLTTVLMLFVGTAIILTTFTRWPAVAIAGLVIELVAVWAGIARLGELVRSKARLWAQELEETTRQSGGPKGR